MASEECQTCGDYWIPEADERVTALHGNHTCAVFVERGTGDIEVHAVLDDGAGNYFCTFGDDESDAAKDLLGEVNKLRARAVAAEKRLAAAEGLLRELYGAVAYVKGDSADDLDARIRGFLAAAQGERSGR